VIYALIYPTKARIVPIFKGHVLEITAFADIAFTEFATLFFMPRAEKLPLCRLPFRVEKGD